MARLRTNLGGCLTAVAVCTVVTVAAAGVVAADRPKDEERLFVAEPLTGEGSFTSGVEGPACDAEGNVYAVNFEKQQTIGKVTPEG